MPLFIGLEYIKARRSLLLMSEKNREPTRWHNGSSVRFAVGRSWIHFPRRAIPKDFKKMIFRVFLLGAQQNRDSVENKPESLLVVSLSKALSRMPQSLWGRQVVWPSSPTRRSGPV